MSLRVDTVTVPPGDPMPRWSVSDLHESLDARSFTDRAELLDASVTRLLAAFDDSDVRACEPRPVDQRDGDTADTVIRMFNETVELHHELSAVAHSFVAVDSRDDRARSAADELERQGARITPLLARLADWVHSLGVEQLAAVSSEVADHRSPLDRLDQRTAHQMSEAEENLYAELSTTGSTAWNALQRSMTSQLTAAVTYPDGSTEQLPITAVRGLAEHSDAAVRRAGFHAELDAWPTIEQPVAAALNAIKGEAVAVNRRRHWNDPLDASLFANSVGRSTYDAMRAAVDDSFDDFRRWMRAKAALHGHAGPLPWWDLVAPPPTDVGHVSWEAGIDWVRDAFGTYSPQLSGLVDRALDERWIDAPPADGKSGGAFCMHLTGDRSLVLLNWSGSLSSAQTTAHELGHAYHNVTLATRTPLQRRLPMALAETASIFCETLAIESRLATADDETRLTLLDISLAGSNQVVVDIASRLRFETALFERRARSSVGAPELSAMMLDAQAETYGDGLDLDTRHPYMWLLKPHYYGAHFYNWPYTYGLLFGLGLFSAYRRDPDRFRQSYDDLLSHAGIDDAETLAARFDLDVASRDFWEASLDVIRARIDDYVSLVALRGGSPAP